MEAKTSKPIPIYKTVSKLDFVESEELKEFDPRIWLDVIEKVTVYHDKRVVFTFQDGREITSQVEDAT